MTRVQNSGACRQIQNNPKHTMFERMVLSKKQCVFPYRPYTIYMTICNDLPEKYGKLDYNYGFSSPSPSVKNTSRQP